MGKGKALGEGTLVGDANVQALSGLLLDPDTRTVRS